MKKTLLLLLISPLITFSQKNINPNALDTLSVDAYGRKIELESNLDSIKKWNTYLLKVIRDRLKKNNLPEKVKTYYEVSEFNAIITNAYWYSENGDKEKAINNYFYILKRTKPKKHKKIIGYVYGELGTRYFEINEVTNAIIFLKKSLLYLNPSTERYYTALIYNNLGYIYKSIKKYEMALSYYNRSLKLSIEENNKTDIANRYLNISKLNIELNDRKSALKNLQLAEKILIEINNKYDLSIVYSNMAELMSNETKKKELIQKSYSLALETKNLVQIEKSGLELFHYNKKRSDYITFSIIENVLKAKDSLYRKGNQNALLKATHKYETEKKESQIKQLTQQKQISDLKSERKSILLYSSILGFLGIILSFYFFFRRFKTNKQNELLKEQLVATEAQKQANESELKALKSQMNPHFIFNALNSIQEQFMYGDKAIANEQMGNFTTLTRQILSVSGKKEITLANEIDILTRYLELEKMRFDSDFFFSIHLTESIDDEYIKIPPMLIQPFVENSIKHGLLHKNGFKKLTINFDIDQNDEYLLVSIEDNGIGRKKSEEIKNKNNHNSFSTGSITQRLQLINNSEMGNDLAYEDLINKEGKGIGTKVTIKIKL